MKLATAEPILSVATGLPRPRWRGVLHSWAFLASIPGGVVLLLIADGGVAKAAAGIYAAGLACVFGVSAAYHRLARSERSQHMMRRADHAMVFVKIAGTYTPVCIVALPRAWGIPMLATAWGIALLGVALKTLAPRRLISYSSMLYLVLGWTALAGLPVIFTNLSRPGFVLLLIGAVVYTTGAIMFWLRKPDPLPSVFGYHEVWHAATVLASVAHFGMVWTILN